MISTVGEEAPFDIAAEAGRHGADRSSIAAMSLRRGSGKAAVQSSASDIGPSRVTVIA